MRKKFVASLLLSLTGVALGAVIWSSGLLEHFEAPLWDFRVRRTATSGPVAEQIKLVLVDQDSLDWADSSMGIPWPWPRTWYGAMVDYLVQDGAAAVVLDIVFTENSGFNVEDDEALGKALASSPRTVAGAMGKTTGPGAEPWPGRYADFQGLEKLPKEGLELAGFDRPIDVVVTNTGFLGNFLGRPDLGAVFRTVMPVMLEQGKAVPALGLAGYLAMHPGARLLVESPELLLIGDARVPLLEGGRALLRYRSVDAYEKIKAAAVVESAMRVMEGSEGLFPRGYFKGKAVFIGFIAPALRDLRSNPVDGAAPGVVLHATVLDNLLADDFIRPFPTAGAVGFSLLLGLLGCVWIVLTGTARHSFVAMVVLLPLPLVAGVAACAGGFLFPVMFSGVAVFLAMAGAVIWSYATEGRQKAFIKSAFRYYLSPVVIEQLLQDPSRLKLGGERRMLTIFFSDLKGFSGISEALPAEKLVEFLNEYLSDMTSIILEEGGTLDKYIGDAIVAFWNAPLDQADHAVRGVRAALRCQQKLGEKRAAFKAKYGHELWMRVGLNTGEVAVGNMGSTERFDYTMLGDAANLASRLEGANKAFTTWIMAAASTWNLAKGAFQGRITGKIRVVGREAPVEVFEPLAFQGQPVPDQIETFEHGVECCYKKDWSGATAAFKLLKGLPIAEKYLGQCEKLLRGELADWDGVWNLSEK